MASGIHVQLAVSGVADCPASSLSEEVAIESVTVDQRDAAGTAGVVGEVTVEHAGGVDADVADVDEVFVDESRSVYRYTHEETCPCTRVPGHGCPIRDLRADGGRLVLSFIAPDLETLRTVVADLRSCCAETTVQRLTRSGPDGERSLLVADRSAFTDRQYEALETAHEMGYFESPKAANSEAVAEELGVSVATFVEHLSVAQTKLFDQLMAN